MEGGRCATPGCCNTAKLQCPACIKLNIQGSFFCLQGCFTDNWDLHKAIHKDFSENYFLARVALCTEEKERGSELERAAQWKWNPIIAADIMGIGTANQPYSRSSSSQVFKSHISNRLVESTNNTVEYMKTTQVDMVDMQECSSLVEVDAEGEVN